MELLLQMIVNYVILLSSRDNIASYTDVLRDSSPIPSLWTVGVEGVMNAYTHLRGDEAY